MTRFAMWLLRLLLPRNDRRRVMDELDELYQQRVGKVGQAAAKAWWRRQTRKFLLVAFLPASWHQLVSDDNRRQSARFTLLTDIGRDVRFALRTFGRRPTFTAAIVVVLGLGIGGTTAMFSIVDAVLIKDLPYRDPGRLVTMWKAYPSWQGQDGLDDYWDSITFSWAEYLDVRDHTTSLDAVAAFSSGTFDDGEAVFTGDGEPESFSAFEASANLFEVLGVQPVLGRTFLREEAAPDGAAARVALLSFEVWMRRFGGSGDVLGRTILLNGETFEVVGVLPAKFRLVSRPFRNLANAGDLDDGQRDIWAPLGVSGCMDNCGNFLQLIGRLAPSASIELARSESQALLARHAPQWAPDQLVRVVPTKEIVTRGFGAPLMILLGASTVLMLIACTNAMGLILGEATGRHRELSIRSAIGASRKRIVRLLLTENVVLGLMGAALGLVVALLGTDALLAVAPPLPRHEEIHTSGRVLVFAAIAGIATGMFFGIVAALSLTKNPKDWKLRAHGRDESARRLQTAVVSVQVGLTVVLLVAGGLFVRSFVRIMSVDPGFGPEGLATITMTRPRSVSFSSKEERWQFFGEILRVTREVPGVLAVSATNDLPFSRDDDASITFRFQRNGEEATTTAIRRAIDPTYIQTMRIPLLAGRLLSDAAETGGMLVSESMAERNWPTESPLGQRVEANGLDCTVVGVVGDVRQEALGVEAQPAYYVPIAQANSSLRSLTLVVRTSLDPATTLPAVRNAIWSVNANIVLDETKTMVRLVHDSEADDRFRALLMWTFACVAGLLAAVGIFGVTARSVSARARELGIRSALGAERRKLIRLVLRDGLLSTVLGLGLGLVVALWASKLIAHLLYDIDARDPLTFIGAAVIGVTVCALAAYLPARRVTKIDPVEVLSEL